MTHPINPPEGFVSLFDGETLTGWHSTARVYGAMYPGGPTLYESWEGFGGEFQENSLKYPAKWYVEDGTIVGRQDPEHPGFGGYLVTDKKYGDFELQLELNLDWPADSGIMLRKLDDRWEGWQVLADLRKSGTIGQFYGNGLAPFHAVSYNLDAIRDENGTPIGLKADDPETSIEPLSREKSDMLEEKISAEDFIDIWKFNDWNHFRIVCEGKYPRISVWVNGTLTGVLDGSRRFAENYDPQKVYEMLGRKGHIALEVHDCEPLLGSERWAPDSLCRWRNIFIKELNTEETDD
ncbi:3-keto-disaccharide hydrolase [Bifidobacterium catulorum]|uniref:DUF1080 domain-containing protein n=1 Tax=Bifidobacterium catulorum TaxID=1630173 RepID=A0A2U2MST7_9BIFI|nr:DUF1080 domain-containing protein [Bifidobacterium catulorum]PWG59902.1 DUF1080 domain-containing protein [Bifidobacterium catulorum]